jgi:hypothetical protein
LFVVEGIATSLVMAGLVPAIHVLGPKVRKTWIPGTSPGMTFEDVAIPGISSYPP